MATKRSDLIVIDKVGRNKYMQEMFPTLFRAQEGKCDCDDPFCPHKGPINPLVCALLDVSKYGKVKWDKFNPKNFPILTDREMPEPELVLGDGFSTVKYRLGMYEENSDLFYTRTLISAKTKNNIWHFPHIFDCIDGFVFPGKVPEWMIIEWNGNSVKFNITNSEFSPDNFYILNKGIVYTDINIIFPEDIDFQIIGGLLYGAEKEWQLHAPIVNSFEYNNKKYTSRIENSMMGIYEN